MCRLFLFLDGHYICFTVKSFPQYAVVHLRLSEKDSHHQCMKRIYSIYFIVLSTMISPVICGQNVFNWTEHISFSALNDVVQHGDLAYGASDLALFTYNKINGDIERITKQSGLSDVNIVALDVHRSSGRIIIGYANGNIDLYRNGRITNINDIARSTLFLGNRRMNHLRVHGNLLYVAMGFGIVVIDLNENLVRETYIIGDGGAQVDVFQVAINTNENKIYAGTANGLYAASLNSPLVFFQSWQRDPRFEQYDVPLITEFKGRTFVCKREIEGMAEDSIFYTDNGNWVYFDDLVPQNYTDLKGSEDVVIAVNNFSVRLYNENFGRLNNITPGNVNRSNFIPVKAVRDTERNRVWMATTELGLTELNPGNFFFSYMPNGPKNNRAYSLYHNGKQLNVATAELSATLTEQFNRSGIFTYKDFTWDIIPPDALDNVADIVAIRSHPEDHNHLYVATWGSGLIELQDGVEIARYNSDNLQEHALTPVNNTSTRIRVGWMDFDDDGNLWMVTSQNDNPLTVLRNNGQWQNFSLGSFASSNTVIQHMMVTSRNQIWVQTRGNGVVVCRESESGQLEFFRLNQNEGSGALPSNVVNAFAEDRNGAIWLGTSAGVGVIFSPQNIFDGGDFDATRITFEEDGVVQALLSQENVTSVFVDGANKKWFGTSFRGAFYTSSDGREEIYAFNNQTSPLPNNEILDITVDPQTGEVFFATPGGITSFRGAATEGSDTFESPFAYPNPVRPDYNGPIFIRGLVRDAQVKITDLQGNLVFETRAEGGQAIWDGNLFDGTRAASGVYTAFMNDPDGFQTDVVKILIVR